MDKIYISGSMIGAKRLRQEADCLEKLGFTVISRWHDTNDPLEIAWDDQFDGRIAEAMACRDAYGVMEADVVIVDTIDTSSTGGTYIELGMSLALSLSKGNVHIIHIGPYRNIFLNLVREHYDSWTEFYDSLNIEDYG